MLPDTELFNYIRIQSYLKNNSKLECNLYWRLQTSLTAKGNHRGGISFFFYNFLNDKSIFVKTNSIFAWEKDLGEAFSENQWQKALQYIHSATKCTGLWELSHKITQQWYLTPHRIAKFDPSTSRLCWRNCAQVGAIFLIL